MSLTLAILFLLLLLLLLLGKNNTRRVLLFCKKDNNTDDGVNTEISEESFGVIRIAKSESRAGLFSSNVFAGIQRILPTK